MPALNFKKEFAPAVLLGLNHPEIRGGKRQTIRAKRKDGRDPKPGETLYHYTGMKTSSCEKLGESICTETHPIRICDAEVLVDGKIIGRSELKKLARLDGFPDGAEAMLLSLCQAYGFPFNGFIIKW